MKAIWLLIYVYRGLIQEPEIFHNETDVQKRKEEIMNVFNEDYDEIGIFQKFLN